MRLVSPLALLAFAATASACGKSGGVANVPPSPGFYRATDGNSFLLLRDDGSYLVHRRSEESIGSTACGAWRQDTISPSGYVVVKEGAYWPSPPRFPSAVFERITLHGAGNGDLVVVGESPWAGSFSQEWSRTSAIALPPCSERST